MKRSFIKLFLLLIPCFAFAQTDTLLPQPNTLISHDQKPIKVLRVLNISQLRMSIALNAPLNSLANTLTQSAAVQIKTYGTPALATLSMRGLGSQHVALLWNGFNTQNSMHGTSDVSLIGLGTGTQNVTLNYGASCAKDGGGSIAGSLEMNSKPMKENGLSMSIANNMGSFYYQRQLLYAGFKSTKGYIQADYLNETSKNDFPYLKNGNPTEKYIRLKNGKAAIQQLNINGNYFINDRNWLSGGIALTDADRQIPVTEFQSINRSSQKDRQLRSFINYDVFKNKVDFSSSAAYFYDQLIYTNPLANLSTTSRIHKWIVKLKAHFNLHRSHDFSFVLENNYAIAKANEYRNAKAQQNFLAFLTSYTYRSKNDKLYANILFRQQLNNRVLAPFVFDAAATYQFHKSVTLQVKAARLFKVPTLNDLYWVPGGQGELLPEKGWSAEWMMYNSISTGHFYFSNSLSNFYYWVNDWIVWLPTRQGYWAPQNVKKVFSRGIQEDISLRYTLRKFVMNVYAGYQFNISTQLSSHQVNDVANKKQLIYEPLHKVYTSISTSYAGFLLQYTHQYTSKRYTSTDHKNALAAFQTANVLLTKTMHCKEFEFMLSLGMDNLYNSRYYMIESRPMPRRNYKVGIIIKCQHEFKP